MNGNNRKKLVIAGNGMATEQLLDAMGHNHGWDVRVLGEEPVHYYNRIMLSPLLGGEVDLTSITPRDADWYRERDVRVSVDKRVVAVNRIAKQVHCADGEVVDYDKLVFATGARSSSPSLPGVNSLSGVSGFRSLADTESMRRWCRKNPGQGAVVVGAGLLGVEAAVGLKRLGADVTLLHRRNVLMNRQLDSRGSELLHDALIRRGIKVRTGCEPEGLAGTGHVTAVKCSRKGKDMVIPAGLVIFATGIRPNIEVAAQAGLDCDRGIKVNESLTTSDSSICALGECCQFGDNTYGLVAPIKEQARVLAAQLCSKAARYREPTYVTRLKVSGLDIHSMGSIEAGEGQEELWLIDARDGVYLKAIVENNRLRGALLIGDVSLSQWLFQLLNDGTDISNIRDRLLFGPVEENTPLSESRAKVA